MGISRRSVIVSTLAATGAALGGAAIYAARPSQAASSAGDVVGKVTVGYQGWFACAGDGAPINGWWHWSQDWGRTPSPSNNAIKAWPDTRDYPKTYPTAYPALGNGQPATLFSSYDQSTVDTHFGWMRQYGIDTAALQRFNPNSSEGPTRDAMAQKVRASAETYGRKFYIMYDISGWTNMQSEIKADWTAKMKAHTASSAYATQDGKPVVCVWGFGFNDDNHAFTADQCLDVITWFKGQGCYVIGGVPREWRTGTGGSRAGFTDTYHALDMISPWMVGAIGTVSDVDWTYTNLTVPDQADCAAHGVDYQPCVLPGDVSARQRVHGDFMWHQFYSVIRAGVAGVYISMFDEYGEGNQIAKTAESQAFSPTGSGLYALDEDGTACSSDYYLRLTGDGGRMLKGQIALTATRPTAPVVGSGTPTPPVGPTQPVTAVISLRSHANGRYVTAENAGASALIANRTAIGSWEQFDQLDAGNGAIALRAHANGKIVTAENAGAAPLIANRDAVGPWETFTLVPNADGSVSLRSAADTDYVCAENTGNSALIANRTAIGAWESFDLISG